MNFAAVALALLSCLACVSDIDATKKSRVCGMRRWPQCAQAPTVNVPTSDYAIMAASSTYSENEVIPLRVYSSRCPALDTGGLAWYRLEALVDGTNASVGAFIEPLQSRRMEAYSCQDDSMIIFDACEPHALDLPRIYNWRVPKNTSTVDTICFRLTILDNDGQCKYTKSCITQQQLQNKASTESGGNSSGSGVGDSDKFDWARGSGAHGEAGNRTERCLRRWDCTDVKMRKFCASDSNTYDSRCHIRLEECLTDTDLYITHSGKCETGEELYPACHVEREALRVVYQTLQNSSLTYWLPTCDCDGLFKPIQCDRDPSNPGQLVCWCSYSNSISAVAGSRRKLAIHCTDPATFQFSCSNK